MASRSIAKDIITLRGSAAIVSEFFGKFLIHHFFFSSFQILGFDFPEKFAKLDSNF